MKTRFNAVAILMTLTVILLAWACSSNKDASLKGFEQTESGLYYKIHTSNDGAQKPLEGDFVTAIGIYRTKDTTFFDSRTNPNPYAFPIMPSTHKGDIFEGLQLLGLGDSATFAIPADSLFLRTFQSGELPSFVTTGEMVFMDMKILKIQTREAFEEELRMQFEEQNPEIRERRLGEESARNEYLLKNKITVQPTATGLYFIDVKTGTGAQPVSGQTVKVHYTGYLLDGTKFDSSVDRKEPFVFTLGQGQVIKGWDEAISMMKVGGKAKLVIPSNLAYGDRGAGADIPPYSTLVFDVELLEVVLN